jgi:hypothetical protein
VGGFWAKVRLFRSCEVEVDGRESSRKRKTEKKRQEEKKDEIRRE